MSTVYNKVTANGQTLIDLSQDTVTSAAHIVSGYTGHLADGTQVVGTGGGSALNLQDKTVSYTPTESVQSATVSADSGYDGLDEVTINVGAVSSLYVGSGITRRTANDLYGEYDYGEYSVNVPKGYYDANYYKSVPNGTEGTPTATKGTVSNNSVTVTPSVTNSSGYIVGGTKTGTAVTVSAFELASGNKVISSNGTGIDVVGYSTVSVDVPTGTARDSSDLTVSGATVNVPAGLYSSAASASVASGTAGTPIATKGTVSDHSVTVTPSVTNTTGYITGGTKTGTAVTVSASELVSGSETKTANGTYDVTNLASLVVNVSGGGGGGSWELVASKEITTSTTSTTASRIEWWETNKTNIWTSAKVVYIRIRDKAGKRSGYFYGTDNYFINSNALPNSSSTTSSNGMRTCIKVASSGTEYSISTQGTTAGYGVYTPSFKNDGRISIYHRFNSSYTGTINGTYTVEVYLLSMPTGKPIFT